MSVVSFSWAKDLIHNEANKLKDFLTREPECANIVVENETLLFWAIRSGPSTAIRLINRMSTKALEHVNDRNRTAWHMAAAYKNLEILGILLDKLSVECVSKVDCLSCTAVHYLFRYGTLPIPCELIAKIICKMDCCAFDVEDHTRMTILDYLLHANDMYKCEIGLAEAKMSLDTTCRVYLRQKDDKCHKRARYLLAESLSSLVAYLNADVVTVVQEYIVDETRVCRKRVRNS